MRLQYLLSPSPDQTKVIAKSQRIKVKFDRSTAQQLLSVGEAVQITVTGYLLDGTAFTGSDTIKVIE